MDVVGVGMASGRIVMHNIKYDESLMKFQQDWGPITALSFRTGDLASQYLHEILLILSHRSNKSSVIC